MNPWFPQWPKEQGKGVIRPAAAAPPRPMKSIPEVIRNGNYPPTFAQVIPFSAVVPAGARVSVDVLLDADFPYRLDAIQAIATGTPSASSFLNIGLDLPSGRRLTRAPVALAGISGSQGGRSFVHFRHRFQPSEMLSIELRNTHPTAPLFVRGVLYGYKLTSESRL